MVDKIGSVGQSIQLTNRAEASSLGTSLPAPSVIPADIGEALALFMVQIGREQRDAARAMQSSADAMQRAAQQEQIDAMRSQARAELAAGLAGAAGAFAEAGVNIKTAEVKQSALETQVRAPAATQPGARSADAEVSRTANILEQRVMTGAAQKRSEIKLDRLKALSAGISGTTKTLEASFAAVGSHAKIAATQAEQRAADLSKRAEVARSDERDAQAFINAGLDALKAYEQRMHETRTAAIFR